MIIEWHIPVEEEVVRCDLKRFPILNKHEAAAAGWLDGEARASALRPKRARPVGGGQARTRYGRFPVFEGLVGVRDAVTSPATQRCL